MAVAPINLTFSRLRKTVFTILLIPAHIYEARIEHDRHGVPICDAKCTQITRVALITDDMHASAEILRLTLVHCAFCREVRCIAGIGWSRFVPSEFHGAVPPAR